MEKRRGIYNGKRETICKVYTYKGKQEGALGRRKREENGETEGVIKERKGITNKKC